MTCREFQEWRAYDAIEPFGEFRSELRHGQMMALTANMNRDPQKRPEPFKAADFMNFTERPKEKKLAPDEINAAFRRILGVK